MPNADKEHAEKGLEMIEDTRLQKRPARREALCSPASLLHLMFAGETEGVY